MAFLGKGRKRDLVLVRTELGEIASEGMKMIELKQIIVGSKNFEDEFVKNVLESVMNDRMESENLEKQALAREFQLEKETRDREFRILFQNKKKDIENLQLKLECLRAKQNTFITSSQEPKFEETKYLIDTDQNSEQIGLDRAGEKEINFESKEILPPVGPCSRISHVTQINSNTLFATQQNSGELAPINSEVSSKTDVDACEPMPASTEGNNKLLTIRCFTSKYPDVVPVSDKTSKSVIQAFLQFSSDKNSKYLINMPRFCNKTFKRKFGANYKDSSASEDLNKEQPANSSENFCEIIDIPLFSSVLKQHVLCVKCKKQGIDIKFGRQIQDTKVYEVNTRLAYAMRSVGKEKQLRKYFVEL
ncbi:hypothetical protein TNCV_2124011 [Trichonephila clavipes]|nr:hypothetical protein TNCV_2124011 [Trichonephila clavipes]